MQATGVIAKERAISYGITGPFLRSTGVDYDVRKDQSYYVYDRFDFDVPVGEKGDNYDRYLLRMEEMEQSMRIIEQGLEQIPAGEINVDMEGRAIPASQMVDEAKMGRTSGLVQLEVEADPTLEGTSERFYGNIHACSKKLAVPPKEDTYGNIEGLMNHFKIVMDGHGVKPPKGEAYFPVEGANGELGFYVVSDGTGTPYRVRVRPPCFTIMSALSKMIQGGTLADIIPTFGSVNMIGGELDR